MKHYAITEVYVRILCSVYVSSIEPNGHGELIEWACSGVVVVHNVQRSSSLKPHGLILYETDIRMVVQNLYIDIGHMALMIAMSVYEKQKEVGLVNYNAFINHDDVMTLAYFTAWSP